MPTRIVLIILAAVVAAGAALTAALSSTSQRDEEPVAATAPEVSAAATQAPVHFDDPHSPSLAAEMAGLGAARYYVQQDDFERALQQLERLEQRFPGGGALYSERTAELAVVQCKLGRHSKGREAIESLQGLTPAPPAELVERARAACQRQ